MSYQTNPIGNRLRINQGWNQNSSLAAYEDELVLGLKSYLMLKEYLRFNHINLVSYQLKQITSDIKILFLYVQKQTMKKKNNPTPYLLRNLKSIFHFPELLVRGKFYNKIYLSNNLSILRKLRTITFSQQHIRKNTFILLIKLLILKNIKGFLLPKMGKDAKYLTFQPYPKRRPTMGGDTKVIKRRRNFVSKFFNKLSNKYKTQKFHKLLIKTIYRRSTYKKQTKKPKKFFKRSKNFRDVLSKMSIKKQLYERFAYDSKRKEIEYIMEQYVAKFLKLSPHIKLIFTSKQFFNLPDSFAQFKRKRVLASLTRFLRHNFFQHIFPTLITYGKFLQPQILADAIAQEISLTKQHRQVLRNIREFIYKLRSFQLLAYRIAIIGKLNGANRTKLFVIKRGAIPIQRFNKRMKYGLSQAQARTGTFGIKVWLFN